jgi:hypothetical protein
MLQELAKNLRIRVGDLTFGLHTTTLNTSIEVNVSVQFGKSNLLILTRSVFEEARSYNMASVKRL